MSIWKKITTFLMMAVMMLTTGIQAFAGSSLEDALNKVNLYVKQGKGSQLLTWKGVIDAKNFAAAVILYRAEDGKEYSAFCANPSRSGMEDISAKKYDMVVDRLDSDPVVWSVITNGYPYKTPQELGIKTDYEAYYATKMVAWAVVHKNYSNLSNWKANGNHNAHVEKAMKDLVAKGHANQYVYKSWQAINPKNQSVETDNKDENYLSQEYILKSNVNINSYRVAIDRDVPKGVMVTDVNNTPKDSFSHTEKTFKVLIPKDTAREKKDNLVYR